MPDILHRISIDASTERVHELITTTDGISRWWTGRPLEGNAESDGCFRLYFGDAEEPTAVMQVVTQIPEEITWRVDEGPEPWVGTRITKALRPKGDTPPTQQLKHTGWRGGSEFMSGCSTNWGAYLTGLKSGVETGQFGAYPHGEISRWS